MEEGHVTSYLNTTGHYSIGHRGRVRLEIALAVKPNAQPTNPSIMVGWSARTYSSTRSILIYSDNMFHSVWRLDINPPPAFSPVALPTIMPLAAPDPKLFHDPTSQTRMPNNRLAGSQSETRYWRRRTP
ncbi:hypothetical protein J6590_082899 [Homalodisca vitripennis]|nr:hypothetical protein J6590_082899 [Homalodisca vitripennis]